MLEKILSGRARKIYLITCFAMLGYVLFQHFMGTGLAAWLSQLQAQYFFSGYYYPELTLLITAIPIVAISFGIGLFHDYLTGQGIFVDHEHAADFSKPGSNSKIEYQGTTRKEVIDQVRSKFRSEIHQLKMLGFEELGFFREIVSWMGLQIGLFGFFGAVGMLANEATRMGPNLTVNGFFILMASRKDATYASALKLGIKFYTAFTDGTCLVTAGYKGIEFEDETDKLYRIACSGPLTSVWAAHKKKVNAFEAAGKRTCEDMSMAEYFSLARREDAYMMKHRSKLSRPTNKKSSFVSETVSTIISALTSMGILLGVVFAFTFAGNLISHVYPTCWFVRNLGIMSLSLNFLGVPAFLGTSWILARTQHNLFTVNGMGTRLYGNEPVPDPGRFVATKWLVLPGVPLLPVRSYLVSDEGVDALGQKTYSMQPLHAIHWAQVKQTIRASMLRYGVLTLLYVGFIAWAVSECR